MREGHRPLLSRRRFVTTAAAGAGAVSAVGLTAGFRPGAAGSGRGLSVADAVADAFKAHRLVALGAADSLQNHYDALMLLLADPRLPGLVDDIGGPARQVLAVEPAAHGPPVRIPAAGDTSADRHRDGKRQQRGKQRQIPLFVPHRGGGPGQARQPHH